MEYWMQGTDLIYCDSNAGVDVPNHEMIVYSQVVSDIAQLLSIHKDPFLAGLGEVMESLIEECEGYFADDAMLSETLNNFVDSWDSDNDTCHDNFWDDIRSGSPTLEKLVSILDMQSGYTGNSDIRVVGVAYYDWIRIKCYSREVNFDIRELDSEHYERILDFLQSDEFYEFKQGKSNVNINIAVWNEDYQQVSYISTDYDTVMSEKFNHIKSLARSVR